MTTLRIDTIDGGYEVLPGGVFTFGRSSWCTFCVDPADLNVSRKAGALLYEGERWILKNTSANRALHLKDDDYGVQRELLPGYAHLLAERRLTVGVNGTGYCRYEFSVTRIGADDLLRDAQSTGPVTLVPPPLTERQRLDLAALLWEYHKPEDGRNPRPRSYEQAAAHLGCTAKALEHRVFELRKKLSKLGYPKLTGAGANEALAVFVIATGTIGPGDFAQLAQGMGGVSREV